MHDVTVDNTTRAYVGDGATVNAGQLTVDADADNTVTAPVNALGVGLGVAGLALARVETTDSSTVDAYIGPEVGTTSAGTPTTVAINGGAVNVQAHVT